MDVLNKYIQELEADFKIDELNLKEAALCLPAKKAKWVSRLITEKTALYKLREEKTKRVNLVIEELKKESSVRLPYPTLEKAAEKHPSIIEVNSKIYSHENLIEFLEKVERSIHSLGFDIKNLIDIIKMETT